MKGQAAVISTLCALLKTEQTAMAQYRAHAQMLRNQGYMNLKHALHGRFYEENDHSKKLYNRILLIGGTPQPGDLVAEPPTFGTEAASMFAADLELETKAIADYNAAVKQADAAGDDVTAELLREILADEDEHAQWLETQLALIKDLGRTNYLTEQVKERKNPY